MTRSNVRLGAIARLAALVSAQFAFAQANPVLPGGNSRAPISINAEKLDYFDKEQKLVYTGSVVATQGESTLKEIGRAHV